MLESKNLMWMLRIAVAGEFLGHGMFAVQGKEQWIGWAQKLLGVSHEVGATLILVVGVIDIILAILVLVKPMRPVILWMAFWGFFTALVRPLAGESFWDFVERFANWGAPLALYMLMKKE